VTKGQPRTSIPAQGDGVRTRIVEGPLFAKRGALNAEESAQLERSAGEEPEVFSISEAEMARARVVHQAHVHEQISHPGKDYQTSPQAVFPAEPGEPFDHAGQGLQAGKIGDLLGYAIISMLIL
jgi:hypothetical protein